MRSRAQLLARWLGLSGVADGPGDCVKAEMKRQEKKSVEDATKTAIKQLEDEFAAMGAERSPKKAMNRMKTAIAKDEYRKTHTKR